MGVQHDLKNETYKYVRKMLIEIYSTVVLMSDEAYELLDSILVSKR